MLRATLAASLALATVAAAGAGLAGTHSAPTPTVAPTPQLSQLLGFVDRGLVRIDPQSFRPLPGTRIAVGSGGCASRGGGTACWTSPPWTISPSGREIAIARNDESALSIVEVAGLRTVASLHVPGGAIGALAWFTRSRLVAVQEAAGEGQRLLVLDPATRRVVARTALGGAVEQVVRTTRGLALLVAPARTIGPARVAIVDARGRVRFASVGRIVAGSKLLPGAQLRADARQPGLALDPGARRAYVVGDSLVAEVDLRTLAVSYHSLTRKRSLLARFWNWLEPTASAKLVRGYDRQAAWLGSGVLAVSGTDTDEGRWRPSGLRFVDTRSWDVRTIDRGGTSFRVADDLLLAWGVVSNEPPGPPVGIGLKAYDLAGRERFHLFDGELVWVDPVYRGRAFVGTAGNAREVRVVDLESGSVVATQQPLRARLLLGAGDGWWGA